MIAAGKNSLWILSAFLAVCILVSKSEAGDYSGNVGKLKAEFTLDWGSDGRVSGQYRYPSRPGIVYKLHGENPKEGVLQLKEYTGSKLTAECYLEKKLNGDEIVWAGEMRNTDGRKLEMKFSRQRTSPVSKNAGGISQLGEATYTGRVGKLAAEFRLTWQEGGRIIGWYSYPSRNDLKFYSLRGRNPREGEMSLDEYTNGELTARCSLKKVRTDGRIVWKGKMKNVDGRSFDMEIVRERESKLQLSWNQKERIKVKALWPKLPREVVWDEFPEAEGVVEMVPLDHMRNTWIHGRIEAFHSDSKRTVISVRAGMPPLEMSSDREYEGPVVTFRIARSLPFPEKRMVGCEVGFIYDDSGTVDNLSLLSISITHWRKSSDGRVEIRGPLSDGEVFESHRMSESEKAALYAGLPTVEFIPDKLAIDREATRDFPLRVIRVMKDYGVCVQVMAAGPGSLELESLSLDEAPQERPWIFIGDRGGKDQVPATQLTIEAG